jgi:glycosyltransferase involved in cell wall biosynthesis
MLNAMLRANLDLLKAAQGKDLVYFPSLNYLYFGILTSFVFRANGKRLIFHFHDLVCERSSRLRCAALVVTDFVHNTKLGFEAVARANKYIKKRRNVVIPFAIITPGSEHGNHKKQSGPVKILFVGQVAKHKGADLLIEAFSRIQKTYKETVLQMVGHCSDPDIAELIDQARARSCHVEYLGYREDVFKFLNGADIYVHPSPPLKTIESFARGVVEAMAAGVPVVCFKSGALAEVVAHESTGLICQEATADALAANLERLINDPNLRSDVASKALEEHRSKYTPSQVKPKWLDFLGQHA